uniref:Uncharacterized protein n=1 Tax=Magallana gigas TaxID=29159 RepID=A0A8W8LT94_MAGGI
MSIYIEKTNEDCIFNSYKEGDVCKDCPAGYFGKNCTEKCKPPTFGFLCLQSCDCPVCHHVVGCVSTTVRKDFVPKIKTTERPQLITNSTQMI